MDLTETTLVEIALDAVDVERDPPAQAMEHRVVSAALARRPAVEAGWATPDAALTPHDAFITTAAELRSLLDTLTPEQWTRHTHLDGGGSVRDVVLHLVGVERYVLGQLGLRAAIDAPRAQDHFPVLRRSAADLEGSDDAQVVGAWWLEVLDLIRACAELGPDHDVSYHHLAGSVRGMVVIRTFELWTHDNDIRSAVGLPANELDDARLALMSTALTESLAIGMALTGTTQPGRTVRIDVSGAGGGRSFDVALSPGDTPGSPELTIGASALDLCRLASNRLTADQIDLQLEGDRSLLVPVLVGAGAFAMD